MVKRRVRNRATTSHVKRSAAQPAREYEFYIRDDGSVEEITTGTVIPAWFSLRDFGFSSAPGSASAEGPESTEPSESDTDYLRTCRRFTAWRFAYSGRIERHHLERPADDDREAWERLLQDFTRQYGSGDDYYRTVQLVPRQNSAGGRSQDPWSQVSVKAGAQMEMLMASGGRTIPKDDSLRRVLARRSSWVRAVRVRLTRLFPPLAGSHVLVALADMLADSDRWPQWILDAQFEPVREVLRREPWRVQYMEGLHSIAMHRAHLIHEAQAGSAPKKFIVPWGRHSMKFIVRRLHSRESARTGKRSLLALRALLSLQPLLHRRRRAPANIVAAIVWIARHHIVGIAPWAPGRTTVANIGRVFGCPPSDVRTVARRLRSSPILGDASADYVLSADQKELARAASNSRVIRMAEEQIALHAMGRRALKMLDEAARIEFLWYRTRSTRPGPTALGKARRLRENGLQLIRELERAQGEQPAS